MKATKSSGEDPRNWYMKNHLKAMKQLEVELIERAMIAGGYKPPYTVEAYAARRGRAMASKSNLYNHLVTQVNSLGVVIMAIEWIVAEQKRRK